MSLKKISLLLIISTLIISMVPVISAEEIEDTLAPELQSSNNLFLYSNITMEEAEKMLLQQMKAIDNVDGDVTDLITFQLPSDFSTRNWFTQSIRLIDRKGNKKTYNKTVYVIERKSYFTGMTSISLKSNDQIDLLKGVKAFDENGQEIQVQVVEVKENSETATLPSYNWYKVEGNIYKVGTDVKDGSIKEVVYRSVDSKGVERFASRYFDTSVNGRDPIIVDLELSKKFVAPGEHISISASVLGDAQDVELIGVSFKLDSNYSDLFTMLRYNPISQMFEGNLEIPAGYENKQWKLNYLSIKLKSGRYVSKSHLDSLSNTTVTVFNGNDIEKPIFKYSSSSQSILLNEQVDIMNGITAYDVVDGDVTSKITVKGTVDNTKIGNYPITYTVTDKAGNVAEFTKIFTVEDQIKPTITVKKSELSGYIQEGEEVLRKRMLDNVTASDNYDGDLTKNVTLQLSRNLTYAGVVTITYKVSDASGNIETSTAKINLNNYSREITIVGDQNKIIRIGSTETYDKGFAIYDSLGNLLDYKVIGEVDYTKPGDYELIYRYTNAIGETSDLKRIITMKEKTPPTFEGLTTIKTAVGKPVDYVNGVVAYDMFGKRLDFNGYGEVNFDKVGTYTYYFNAIDSLGQKVNGTRTIIVEEAVLPFYDVPESHPYFKEIYRLKVKKIINGYDGNLYKPKVSITRGQVAALIYRSGIQLTPIRGTKNFTDVPKSYEFYNEIQALYQAGIIDGDGNKFNPKDTLTREQLAKILVLAFKLENKGGYDGYFKDVAQNHWAYPYITILASNEVTVGDRGNYMPKGKVTREHFALFMYRALGY